MDNAARERLREIVQENGGSFWDHREQCEALLNERLGDHRLEKSVLLSALREGVPDQLERFRDSAAPNSRVLAIAGCLRDNQGLDSNAATWATEAWAYALDVHVGSRDGVPEHPHVGRRAEHVPQDVHQPGNEADNKERTPGRLGALLGSWLALVLGVMFWLFAPPSGPSRVPENARVSEVNAPSNPSQDAVPAGMPARLPEKTDAAAPRSSVRQPVDVTPAPAAPRARESAKEATARSAVLAEPRRPRVATIPAETTIAVRALEEIDSGAVSLGDRFNAAVEEPVVVNEAVVIPKGSDAVVQVASVKKAGRIRGSSEISLQLVQVVARGQSYAIVSSNYDQKASGIGHLVKKGKGVSVGTDAKLEFTLTGPITVALP